MPRRAPTIALAWWAAPFIVVSMVHVVLLGIGNPVADATKIALMPLLAVPVVFAAVRSWLPRGTTALLMTALLFSWLGDSVGVLFPTAPEIPLMLAFFGLAHLAYILLFVRAVGRGRMPRWALIYVVWWVGMLVGLGPHTGGLFIAVAVYGIVLGATAAFSARCPPVVATGGALFLASDTILAFRLFLPGGLPAWSDPAIMLTYTIGQGLIITGTLLALQKRRPDA